jgi:hypothetical protein
MGAIDRPAVRADSRVKASMVHDRLAAVVTILTKGLELAEPKLVPIAAMAFDVIDNRRRRGSAMGQAHSA